jgi:signal transduction histidine kinase
LTQSLYGRIAIWFGLCFLLATGGFALLSLGAAQGWLGGRGGPGLFLKGIHSMAVSAYESGGREALRRYLGQLDEAGGRYRLLDEQGRDLISGEKVSTVPDWMPLTGYTERGLRLVVDDSIRPSPQRLLPYFAVLLLVILALGLAFALSLARPLRSLETTVQQFGRGDLSVRAEAARTDEIGRVASAFNVMADRVESLLTSERRLMQDVAHELRSPLARLTLAVDAQRDNPDRFAAAAVLKGEVRRLSGLVDELLHMAQAEGDPAERNLELIDIRHLVSRVLNDCRIELDTKSCRADFDSSQAELPLMLDWELLRRAVENVLRNAIRYAPAGSVIEVRLNKAKHTLISVRDHGPGVPADALDKIFRPFFRMEADRGRESGGVGLGLAIAKRAVILHRGRIWAERAEPGLRISIELPDLD